MGRSNGLIREIRIEPAGRRWGDLARQSWERARNDSHCMHLRAQLGLPTDRPVIMTGHQPGFWHAGVLVKQVSVDAAAECFGGAACWVVVDQDEVDPGLIAAPVWGKDGLLERGEVRLLPAPVAGVAVGSVAAAPVLNETTAAVLESVEDGIELARRMLQAHVASESMAAQCARGAIDALQSVTARLPLVFASALLSTDVAMQWVTEIDRGAPRAIGAYNDAVRQFKDAGIPELTRAGDAWELPLWRLGAGKARERVWSGELERSAKQELAPRALFLTAILRRFACDLFVHGVGGWSYDRATEAWVSSWRGEELAPMALCTATVLLDLDRGEPVSAEEASSLVWRAHHARHHPGVLGLHELERRKRALVEEISTLRDRGERTNGLYGELTALLRDYRDANREALHELAAEAEQARRRAEESEVLEDRTWPFILHPRSTLMALRSRVRAEFGVTE